MAAILEAILNYFYTLFENYMISNIFHKSLKTIIHLFLEICVIEIYILQEKMIILNLFGSHLGNGSHLEFETHSDLKLIISALLVYISN